MMPSLSLATLSPLSSVRLEHEISVDDHAYRETGSDRKRGLNIQVAAHDPLPDLIKTLRSAAPDCLDEIVLIAAGAGFGSDAEQG